MAINWDFQKKVADLDVQLVYKTMRADSYDTMIDSRLRRVGRAYFMRNSALNGNKFDVTIDFRKID